MSLNMERFTRQGEEVIYKAHDLAKQHRQRRMEPEHLLLALLSQTEGFVPQFYQKAKVPVADLKRELQSFLTRLESSAAETEEIYLSYSSEQCIRKAEYEADRLRDEFLAPEHLFLGILANAGTEASLLLRAKGIEPNQSARTFMELKKGRHITSRGSEAEAEEAQNMISEYCQDLVELAAANKFDPVIGRDEEVRRVIQVLSRRSKNNPVLIGEPGVGKTAIIEGLAQRILEGDVPETLKNSALLSLDLAGMVAGAKYRGEFEERLKKLLKEVELRGRRVVLFIDELHTLVGAGASEGAMDASNMLKPALARGVIRCIGATTIDEFKKHIETDPALERRFQQVLVKEPSVPDCIAILRGLKEKYEVHHGVRIKDAAIVASAKLAARYITGRFLPDKAIDLIDEAASTARIEIDSMPTAIDQTQRKIIQLEIEKAALQKEEDLEARTRLSEIDHEIKILLRQNEELKATWQGEREAIAKVRLLKGEIEKTRQEELAAQRAGNLELAAKLKYGTQDQLQKELAEANRILADSDARLLKEEVDEEDIARVVSKWTGIPVQKMLVGEQEKLLRMEEVLTRKLVGQARAVGAVANAIRRARTGIQDPNRPLGSFLFLGPTGVGKTEMAKVLAGFLFDDEKAMVRLDMSEYMERHAVSRLIGAPPGYQGYDEGGLLTEAIHRKPYSVVLLDEVEKGHPEIFNLLLQILDDGILTDSRGLQVDFKNCIIILTTNLGSDQILSLYQEGKKVGPTLAKKILLGHFRPELLNRLDDLVVFEPLSLAHIEELVAMQVEKLSQRLMDSHDTRLQVTAEARKFLSQVGFDPEFGARPLKRVIQRELEDVLAYKILDGTIKPGDAIEVRLQGQDKLSFHRIKH